MTAIIVICDRSVVAHLAVALHDHRRALERQRVPEPPELEQLEEMLRRGSQRVAATPSLAEVVPPSHDDDVPAPILLTLAATAQRLSVGVTTVKGLAKEGVLPVVRIGSAVRVHEADLVEYAESLREDPRRVHTKGVA